MSNSPRITGRTTVVKNIVKARFAQLDESEAHEIEALILQVLACLFASPHTSTTPVNAEHILRAALTAVHEIEAREKAIDNGFAEPRSRRARHTLSSVISFPL